MQIFYATNCEYTGHIMIYVGEVYSEFLFLVQRGNKGILALGPEIFFVIYLFISNVDAGDCNVLEFRQVSQSLQKKVKKILTGDWKGQINVTISG